LFSLGQWQARCNVAGSTRYIAILAVDVDTDEFPAEFNRFFACRARSAERIDNRVADIRPRQNEIVCQPFRHHRRMLYAVATIFLAARVSAPNVSAHSKFGNRIALALAHRPIGLPQRISSERLCSRPRIQFVFDRIEAAWTTFRQDEDVFEQLMVTNFLGLTEVGLLIDHRVVNPKPDLLAEKDFLFRAGQRFASIDN
jgi:hypothetical protein